MPGLDISPQQFHRVATQIAHLAAEFLTHLPTAPSFPKISGAESETRFGGDAPEQGMGTAALDVLAEVAAGIRPPGPRMFGYVVGSGEPIAAAADLLASVLNQNVTAWRSAPAAVSIERTVVRWIAEAIGCKGFVGSFTGGGSSANLMGLAMAREAKCPANDHGAQPGMVYASSEVHMSISKAMALLGLGCDSLRLIPADDAFRMMPGELKQAIAEDRRAGKKQIAVVGNGGTVNTGAIDPLRELAEIAHEFGLWMHVDGAYGALAAMVAPERFRGIELADSLSLDPHKWLYQPLDCGMLLFRDAAIAQKTFSHTGDYARALATDPIEGYAFFEESAELSRRFRALKLWLSIRYHGLNAFREAMRSDIRHAERLAEHVRRTEALQLLATGDLSAVCFRYTGAGRATGLDTLNAAILRRIIERGRVYLSNATIRGSFALRACFVNHRTTDADVDAVVEETLAAARELV